MTPAEELELSKYLIQNAAARFKIHEIRLVPWRVLFNIKARWTEDDIDAMVENLEIKNQMNISYKSQRDGVVLVRTA